MEDLWWHRCERWWNQQMRCPYSGLGPKDEPDDDEEPLIPIGEKPKPKVIPPGKKETVKVPVPVKVPIPEPIAVYEPIPPGTPAPVPVRAPAPAPAPKPGTAPARPPVRVPIHQPITVQERRTWTPSTASQSLAQTTNASAQRTKARTSLRVKESEVSGQYQDMRVGAELSKRLKMESARLREKGTSAVDTYIPPYSGGLTPPSSGNVAENLSSRVAETALARYYSRSYRRSRRGLDPDEEQRAAVEEAERIVARGGSRGKGTVSGEKEGTAGPTPEQVAAIAAIVAATTAAVLLIRSGGGSSPGTGGGVRGRGGFTRMEELTPAAVGGGGKLTPTIQTRNMSFSFKSRQARSGRQSRRERANAQNKSRRKAARES